MKYILFVLIACAVTTFAVSDWFKERPEAKVTFLVMDQDGKQVQGARIEAGGLTSKDPEEERMGTCFGPTDNSGRFVAQLKCENEIAYSIGKMGFHENYHVRHTFKHVENGKCQPWNPTFEVVLKAIKNPIAMYAKRVSLKCPEKGKPVGYDLTIGDWVAPYGKGKNRDFLVCTEGYHKNSNDKESKVTLGFSNQGDGIQFTIVPRDVGSFLRSKYEAPEDGYQPQQILRFVRRPDQARINDFNNEKVYYFRVRTVLDESGKVKSALYGKVYGDFMDFTYYLNPTPNDRNVECDTSKNLLTAADNPKEP